METIKIKTHIGHDGLLNLSLPISVRDIDCDVEITYQPTMSQEEWLHFIDETAGSLADDPIERLPQGEHEQREPIE